jgi:hypothetical protein
MRGVAVVVVVGVVLAGAPGLAQETVTSEPPKAAPETAEAPPKSDQPCPKGNRGGALAGVVIGALFWPLLPMSIPVLVTQGKKLKSHNQAMRDRRCQYAPRQ